jgi:hypothetical protein
MTLSGVLAFFCRRRGKRRRGKFGVRRVNSLFLSSKKGIHRSDPEFPYPSLSAATGSVRAARQAGIDEAAAAVDIRRIATATNVTVSVEATP